MAPRIAILTGGGDCPGLNAVIRAAAKTAILDYSAEVIGVLDGYEGLIRNHAREIGYLNASGILAKGGTILGTSNRANPFKYPTMSDSGETRFDDLSDQAVKHYKALNVDALIVVGGDGTMSIANRLCEKGLRCIGVPKTIDNDLYGTDRTFGFDTAMAEATVAVDKLQSTAQSHHRVMILEVMGRNAGWIALEAGIAGGGDVILIPEIPYRLDVIRDYLHERLALGKRFSIVVVSEGARPVGGEVVIQRRVADGSEPIRLGGIGYKLCTDIEDATGIESRAVILGHLQRGGSPTPFDRVLATRFGCEATRLAMDGASGMMVGLRGTELKAVPIAEVSDKQRVVDPNHDLVKTARSVGTCMGDERVRIAQSV